jgi:hypothetical protein
MSTFSGLQTFSYVGVRRVTKTFLGVGPWGERLGNTALHKITDKFHRFKISVSLSNVDVMLKGRQPIYKHFLRDAVCFITYSLASGLL